jgi:anti-sigma B factor antagonist
MAETLDVRLDEHGGTTVAYVDGEIDLTTAPRLADDLRAAVESATVLVVDLSAVAFLDSAGLAVLHSSARRMAELSGGLRLVVTPQSVVYRALDISGLTRVIPTYPSFEAAMADGTAPHGAP